MVSYYWKSSQSLIAAILGEDANSGGQTEWPCAAVFTQGIRNVLPTTNFRLSGLQFIAVAIAGTLISGCSNKLDPKVDHLRSAVQVPAVVGVYYSPEFRNYEVVLHRWTVWQRS